MRGAKAAILFLIAAVVGGFLSTSVHGQFLAPIQLSATTSGNVDPDIVVWADDALSITFAKPATGEIYYVTFNPAHRWFYISQMGQDEVLLLKCFDSARDGRARYSAHTAFKDPGAPADAPSRQSIEVRTIALFAS